MKIEDNFLDQSVFGELQTLMMGDGFDWQYSPIIDSTEDINNKNKFQFVHIFYAGNVPFSPYFKEMIPILNIIKPISLWRIKANLLTKTSNHIENPFHVDMPGLSEEKQKQWTTSIFYVNTNDGYTVFEDGTKIESVANRIVSFPEETKHRGTSCTDEKIRMVINFNFLSSSMFIVSLGLIVFSLIND